MASPACDSDNGVGMEFEGSDNEGIQTDITVSDSDEEYLPENDPDVSSSEESGVDESDMAAKAVPAPP